jgi:hypothetical protein
MWTEKRHEAPLRVDFAGGWLDVPRFAIPGAYIVNCAISPTVTLNNWCYHNEAGLGGSAAWALLNGKNGVESEIDLGVGWQDPAVISETGLCVWRSGQRPDLEIKTDGHWLRGRMALYWTGSGHSTPDIVRKVRRYSEIETAGKVARQGVWRQDIDLLLAAVRHSYNAQMTEGMAPLPFFGDQQDTRKYCGGGWGGYALYLFKENSMREEVCSQNKSFTRIEPYLYAR